MLAGESGVDLISLTPVFDRAAEESKMIYYPLDAHWDAQGREIAARFIAEMLRKRFPVPSSKGVTTRNTSARPSQIPAQSLLRKCLRGSQRRQCDGLQGRCVGL
jgi:hypothetical protein